MSELKNTAAQVSLNVRFLLWKKESHDPQDWPNILGRKLLRPWPYEAMTELMEKEAKQVTKESLEREINRLERKAQVTWTQDEILEFLSASSPSDAQIRDLAAAFQFDEEELRYSDLLAASGVDIFLENVRYLFGFNRGFKKGFKQEAAKALGVNVNTVSSWITGRKKPDQESWSKISMFFGVPSDIKPNEDPLFLSFAFVHGTTRRRQWAIDRIAHLSPAYLDEIFPALKKLLDEK